MALNGNSYGLNAQMFGFTISELCRSTKDSNIPFRLSGTDNMHDYKSMSVKDISKLVKRGKEVIFITSGAVGLGKKKIGIESTEGMALKQACAAIGQSKLMSISVFF